MCPFAILCLLFTTYFAPSGAKKKRFAGMISRFHRRYKGPNYEGLNAPRHKCAPLPTLCLLYVTVPHSGQRKSTLWDKNIEEICPFPQLNKEGACFALKIALLI